MLQRPLLALATGVVALAALLAACASGQAKVGGATVTVDGRDIPAAALQDAVAALCAARAQATTDPQQARVTFQDRAHDRLHDLARAAGERDAAVAGRLLEAKNQVERDLTGRGPVPASLPADLDRLVAAASAALTSLDLDPPACAAAAGPRK